MKEILTGMGARLGSWCLKKARLYGNEDPRELLLEEAAAVVYDFLNHGSGIQALSGGTYQGTICVRLSSCRDGRYGFRISMYETGDIQGELAAYKAQPRQAMAWFVGKYGGCYDASRNALVYETRRKAALSGSAGEQLTQALWKRISGHPLAELASDSMIQTRLDENSAL